MNIQIFGTKKCNDTKKLRDFLKKEEFLINL